MSRALGWLLSRPCRACVRALRVRARVLAAFRLRWPRRSGSRPVPARPITGAGVAQLAELGRTLRASYPDDEEGNGIDSRMTALMLHLSVDLPDR